jgi:voltage-gated potassium channel
MDQTYEDQQFKGPGYELFILTISILSIANLLLIWFTPDSVMEQVVLIINFIISIFLMLDFLYRLLSSPSKKDYFVKDYGWLDSLGSLPIIGFQLFRLLRIIRVLRTLREMGTREVSREFRRERAATAMVFVVFLVILVLQFGSYFIIGVEERSPNANITSPLDALWWTFVSITTVGFGDKYPVTNLGRVIGTLVILTGVVLFSVLTGYIATNFLARHDINDASSISPEESDLASIRELLEVQTRSLHNLEEQFNLMHEQLNKKDSS